MAIIWLLKSAKERSINSKGVSLDTNFLIKLVWPTLLKLEQQQNFILYHLTIGIIIISACLNLRSNPFNKIPKEGFLKDFWIKHIMILWSCFEKTIIQATTPKCESRVQNDFPDLKVWKMLQKAFFIKLNKHSFAIFNVRFKMAALFGNKLQTINLIVALFSFKRR